MSISRRNFLAVLGWAAGATQAASATAGRSRSGWFDVRELGAASDGRQLATERLQAGIEACARAGGGTVYFPAGTYLTGTLFLKSHVRLHLEAGAQLLGSTRLEDYPPTVPPLRSYTDLYTERSLLYGEGLEGVSIEGQGTIAGQGQSFRGPWKVRPYLVRLISCREVAVTGITLRDSPMWVQHYLACEGVRLEGLTVRSRCNGNNDGMDIDACERVRIANCDIASGDDAIVLKSTLDRPCRQVTITNCVLSSDCNALKLGTESNGGFQDIVISNCVIHDTGLAGLALETVDGGTLERVSVSNLTMRDTRCPIFIRLGNRARPFKEGMAKPGLGRLRRVSIRDVLADGADRVGCSITGLPERPVEEVTLENIRLTFCGGGTDEDAQRPVREHPEKYPECNMFGSLPAYGFYCRHARGLELRQVKVGAAAPDARPSLVCQGVEDLRLAEWKAETVSTVAPVTRFNQVRRAVVQGCRSPEGARVFLRVEGADSGRIRLAANELEEKTQAFEVTEGALAGAVTEAK